MENENKWIAVDKRSNKLWIRFRVKGYSQQFQLATRLKDTKKNRELVRVKRDIIANDIALGQFDPTLERYQFRAIASFSHAPPPPQRKDDYDLKGLWELFLEFQVSQLQPTTIYINYRTIGSLIEKMPTQALTKAPAIKNWLLKNYSLPMAWRYLGKLSQCCRWALDEGLIEVNPFEQVKIKRPKPGDTQAFTLEQRDLIIQAFENDGTFSHYASLVKFLFWTGCRHGEAFALRWDDISDDCTAITFSKSRNLLGIEKTTKNGKVRNFECGKDSRLCNLLSGMKSKGPVFLTKHGSRMTSSVMGIIWNRRAGVVGTLADKGVVPYLRPYSTRHTFATWAIASGMTPDRVAYWIGDDIETVLHYYVHPEASKGICPDF